MRMPGFYRLKIIFWVVSLNLSVHLTRLITFLSLVLVAIVDISETRNSLSDLKTAFHTSSIQREKIYQINGASCTRRLCSSPPPSGRHSDENRQTDLPPPTCLLFHWKSWRSSLFFFPRVSKSHESGNLAQTKQSKNISSAVPYHKHLGTLSIIHTA